jgi:hypothetical protein
MNPHTLLLLLLILTSAAACTHQGEPTVKTDPQIQWGLAIRTIEAKQDTIGDEIGICITNDALTYTLDSTTAQQLTKNRYAIQDLSGDEPAVWVLKGQEFIHAPVQCGSSDGKLTLITKGLSGGEFVVTSTSITPQK